MGQFTCRGGGIGNSASTSLTNVVSMSFKLEANAIKGTLVILLCLGAEAKGETRGPLDGGTQCLIVGREKNSHIKRQRRAFRRPPGGNRTYRITARRFWR